MNEYVVYILYSIRYKKIYIGFTTDIISRMKSHNYFNKKGYTTKFRPWIVIYTEIYFLQQEALNREKFFKSGKGRELIYKNIIPNCFSLGLISA